MWEEGKGKEAFHFILNLAGVCIFNLINIYSILFCVLTSTEVIWEERFQMCFVCLRAHRIQNKKINAMFFKILLL